MNIQFKPEGYNSISPYFIIDNTQQFIDLMVAVFDAVPLRRYDREDGQIAHAELKIDDSVIMLSSSTENFPAITLCMHVYVRDSKDIYEKALAAGCTGIEEPINKENDPDIRGTFIDLAGNMWSVGTQKSD